MNEKEFYAYYLPALDRALLKDDINTGFFVKGPVFYLETSEKNKLQIDQYLDKTCGKDYFLDRVENYFDAISHYFEEIDGLSILEFRQMIKEELLEKKSKFGIE